MEEKHKKLNYQILIHSVLVDQSIMRKTFPFLALNPREESAFAPSQQPLHFSVGEPRRVPNVARCYRRGSSKRCLCPVEMRVPVLSSPYGTSAGLLWPRKARILPYLDIAATIDLGPHTQDIFATSHAQNSTTNFLSCFQKLVTDDCQEKILPVSISNTLF